MVTELTRSQQLCSFEKVPLHVYPSAGEGSKKVAQEIASLIRKKWAKGEQAVLGLATGSTPRKVYEHLITMHREEGLSFSNVVTFNLDEYYPISHQSLYSYHMFMEENFFSHIDIDRGNCFMPSGEAPADLTKLHLESR